MKQNQGSIVSWRSWKRCQTKKKKIRITKTHIETFLFLRKCDSLFNQIITFISSRTIFSDDKSYSYHITSRFYYLDPSLYTLNSLSYDISNEIWQSRMTKTQIDTTPALDWIGAFLYCIARSIYIPRLHSNLWACCKKL